MNDDALKWVWEKPWNGQYHSHTQYILTLQNLELWKTRRTLHRASKSHCSALFTLNMQQILMH